MKPQPKRTWRRARSTIVLAVLSIVALTAQGGVANAKGGGGTATPPPGAVAPFVEPTLPDPVFSTDPLNIHQFDVIGFLQDATVDASNANCPNTPNPVAGGPNLLGGTATLNGVKITVPCNMTIQMPANTFTWADFVNFPGAPPVTLKAGGIPSFEMHVQGNIVAGKHIAGLMFFSQQSLNLGQGYITAINYTDGSFTVDTGDPANPAKVQLNDPKLTDALGHQSGRYSAGQSPDPRLSVDQANPTVHAHTGYPMCIPRIDPKTADDPLCPQQNRPLTGAVGGCRNFSVAGVAPPASGELSRPPAGQKYCSEFVMKDPAPNPPVGGVRAPTDPDSRQQAPFEVGDRVDFSGSLFTAPDKSQYISANTVEASVDIFTQPGSKPSYVVADGSIGTADPTAIAVNGFPLEGHDRLVLEAETTDVRSPVDIYLVDITNPADPTKALVRNRWVTPQAMTGENNGPNQAGTTTPIGGGITTQNTGPQPERARLRANKAPAGLLSNPTRTVRVSNRATCLPNAPMGHDFDGTANPPAPVTLTAVDTCLNGLALNANGLQAGLYTFPMFNFILPENIRGGDPIVPNDFWHLGFLRFGEGDNPLTPTVGPLEPAPW